MAPVVSRWRSIEVLRAVAALLVLYRHLIETSYIGSFGVDLFFVISGFIMATVAVGRTPGEFLAARFWRVMPAYWVALIPVVLLAPALDWPTTLTSLTLLPIFGGERTGYMIVAWTLMYELLFYAAVASALWLKRWWPALLMFALALSARPFTDNQLVAFVGSPILFEFGLGVLVARIPRSERTAIRALPVALILLVLTPASILEQWEVGVSFVPAMFRVGLWGIPAALIVYSVLSLERRFASQRWEPLVWYGNASYALYLVHKPIIDYLLGLGFKNMPAIAMLCACAAVIFHLAVEQPLRRSGRIRTVWVQRRAKSNVAGGLVDRA